MLGVMEAKNAKGPSYLCIEYLIADIIIFSRHQKTAADVSGNATSIIL